MTEPKPFSPKEFLKKRRPERFSDSIVLERPEVERSLLEYHLDQLTSNSLETPFEDFARELAKREICPNLIPQTGPTGGGDSKVDSETFPVAPGLSLTWYAGSPHAGEERWGFAFSAKKDWRDKVRSDIAKIAKTGRGYAKAFFVTNQFVRDKTRAEVEDALSEKHGLDVRILDRNWILDRVFGSGHEDLALKHLNVGGLSPSRRPGPTDFARAAALEEVEDRIRLAASKEEMTAARVEDVIEALEFSRGLEESENLIRGRMSRAIALADKYGTPNQQVRARYQAAWTAFWWLEDPSVTSALYTEVEAAVAGSVNPRELEYLSNLWFLLFGASSDRGASAASFEVIARRERLQAELGRLAGEEERPSAAFQARTLGLLVRLTEALEGGDVEGVLHELSDVVDRSRGLVGFPMESLVRTLVEASGAWDDVPAFNDLFDRLVESWAGRKGEVEAAQLLLARGTRQLDSDRPLDAIASIGSALTRLYKQESKDDLIRALYLIGVAYRRVGLMWAARGSLLHAASLATADFHEDGTVTDRQLAAYEDLRWIELALGRLPQTLAWHELTIVVAAALEHRGRALPEVLGERSLLFDAILGIGLLRLDLKSLTRLERLPSSLERLHLYNSEVALRWALGEGHVPDEFREGFPDGEDLESYFALWLDQPAAKEVPERLELGLGQKQYPTSSVLGCRVSVETASSATCMALSESFLAALEALLATGFKHGAFAREPALSVFVRESEYTERPFSYRIESNLGRPELHITLAPFDVTALPPKQFRAIKDRLYEMLLQVLAHIVFVDDQEAWLKRVFGDELAVERAVNFTSSIVVLSNVLGNEPKNAIVAWHGEDDVAYPLLRGEEWTVGVKRGTAEEADAPALKPAPSDAPVPPELSDRAAIPHDRLRTHSVIRESLWEEAGWRGTLFMWIPEADVPPILALVFANVRAADEIFRGWLQDIGPTDTNELLRVAIIRGIDRDEPNAYRVSVGSDPLKTVQDATMAFGVFRLNTMTPESTKNLDGFLERYEDVGSYKLAPAAYFPGEEGPTVAHHLEILKNELVVREAWEVGVNDLDRVAILPDTQPVIPPGELAAPVLELLRARRGQQLGSPEELTNLGTEEDGE